MSSSFKRKSKSAAAEAEEESTVWEASAERLEARRCPSTLLLRIEETTGIPSPTAGVTADVFWQLDLGNKRAVSGSTNIVGTGNESPCSALFHEDFVVRRSNDAEQLLLTLRSSTLGNSCFGKVVVDIEKDFVSFSEGGDGEGPKRVGDPGESVVMKWIPLVAYFKSNNPDVQYEMKVRVVAKVVNTPNNKLLADSAYPVGVHSMGKQAMYILTDPNGTLPGVPIKSLLFLRRSSGAEKIAKGSLHIDTMGESRVLVSGKIGKRRSFFSAAAFSRELFTGASAFLDAEQGLIERDAQELLANAAKSSSSSTSSDGSSPKVGPRAHSISDLSKSPRASQRASLLFKGSPKVAEFDESAKTYAWLIEMPVPNVNPLDGTPLPPSCSYSNDGADIFGELSKNTESAFAVRHVVNARCGMMTPFQAEFLVHALGMSATPAATIAGDAPSGGSLSFQALLSIDYTSLAADGAPQKLLELSYTSSKVSVGTIQAVVHGSISIGADGAKGHEWKAFECQWNNPQTKTLRQTLQTSVFGPPANASQFSTLYYIEITVNGEIRLPKTVLPVHEILPTELEQVDQQKIAGQTLDTLHMRSHAIERSSFIAMPPVFPNEKVTLYSAETGEHIHFADAITANSGSPGSRKGKSPSAKRSKRPKIEASKLEVELESPIQTPKPSSTPTALDAQDEE